MFKRFYTARFTALLLAGAIAVIAGSLLWHNIAKAQTAKGTDPVDYVQQADGSILATGGIYSHWFDPIQDGMFMDSSGGGFLGAFPHDHSCVEKGHNTAYQCAQNLYTQLQVGSSSSVNTQRKGMVFKKQSDNLYVLEFPALLYLYSHPNAAMSLNRCDIGLEFNGSNRANMIGIPRADGMTSQQCAQEINDMATNWQEHGVPTLPANAVIRGATNTSNSSPTTVRNEQDVYRGIWIPSCIANTTSSSGIEAMNACMEERRKGLAQLSNACSTGGANAAECSRMHTCLSNGGGAKSVKVCESEDPELTSSKANRWLNNDFSQEPNMATISQEEINAVCSNLSNLNEQRTCISNAQAAKTSATTPENPEGEEGGESPPSCVIEGVGWIVCPTLTFLANIADRTYAFLADNFLTIETALVNTDSSSGSGTTGTFEAWRIMLNIANAAFIVFFMFIIYSQVSGMGVTNYGIKKMLPRLIVGAILVNLSFFICQVAVDLSNILGRGIEQILSGVGGQLEVATPDMIRSDQDITSTSNWVGVTATVLAGGVAIYLALPFLAGGLLAGVVALVTVGFLLIARKALVVLLIVIAPLAFVAYLLPNTEKWFTRWRSLFTSMLLVFPVVSLLFGAGKLAGGVLSAAATKDDVIMQIVAQVVVIIPLFAVWGVMKKSMEAAGAVTAKINGIGSKAQGAAKSRGDKAYENSRLGQFKRYRKDERNKRRALIQAGAYSGSNRNPLNWGRNASSAVNRRINASPLSGQFGMRSAAAGEALYDKEEQEAAANILKYQLSDNAVAGLDSDNIHVQALAAESLAKKGDWGAGELAKYIEKGGKITSRSMADTIAGVKNTHAGLGAVGTKAIQHFEDPSATGAFSTTLDDFKTMTGEGIVKLSDETLARQNAKAVEMGAANIGAERAQKLLSNDRLSSTMSAETKKKFESIAAAASSPVPTQIDFGDIRQVVDDKGKISKVQDLRTGQEIMRQLHTLSGAEGNVSAKSLRDGAASLSVEQLAELVKHSSSPRASGDVYYEQLNDIAKHELGRRNATKN